MATPSKLKSLFVFNFFTLSHHYYSNCDLAMTINPTSDITTSTEIKMTISGIAPGLKPMVRVQNEWTPGQYFRCNRVNGSKQSQVLDNTKIIEATDTGGGTYSASYIVDRPGKITVSSFSIEQGAVYWYFLLHGSFIGNNSVNKIKFYLRYLSFVYSFL